MGRFQGAPTKASIGFITLPKDRYEFEIGEPKAYERTQKGKDGADDKIVQGINWPLIVRSPGQYQNKVVFFRSAQDNDISLSQEKALMMAADGVEPKADNDEVWSLEHEGDDFSADTTSGVVGEGYRRHKGKRVFGEVDITISKQDNVTQFQKWVRWDVVNA